MSSFSSAFSGYRELPQLVGYPYLVISFFGRLPTAMIIIGVLTLIVASTGSVAVAAYCSAGFAIANGIGNVLIGRLTDRFGQRTPLLLIAPLNVFFILLLVWLAPRQPATASLVANAAAVGITTCPIGPLARVRWYPIASRKQLPAAMSWETVNDELVFVLGPAAVGIIAAALSPAAPMILAAIIVGTCVIPFALSKHARGPSINDDGSPSPSFGTILRHTRTPLLSMVFMGMFFGAMQTTVTAFAESNGLEGLGGLIYAFMGLGAAITALIAVALPARFTFVARIFVGGLGLLIGAAACSLATSGITLAALVFFAGIFIGPIGVSIFTLAGKWAPKGGDGVANTAIVSANVLGVAAASALIGNILESNIDFGFFAAALCGLGIAVVAATAGRADQRAFAAR
ncbi:MFS family permease [Trueperella bonasi]|uniref:MFS family permease n=1 Tax=Trueperella bonasi TaxID=312286 RepID=A0ABT9NI65_9ACTO|nr:MFS transporter [Trueperella bonasi]MDP9807092.1 MFS family permease [Trueperella bonasi]